ncbi:hypothetical protein CDAR_50821 [Caerostris darwini]|uniref:Uncharacterized protein n=1 Tax=Caerostris darwini TaxID=1538125 RepID=A0AAV4U5T7_9ARAC|nr:hypothetical protein CDAR_50821 [Caerostris darwini]
MLHIRSKSFDKENKNVFHLPRFDLPVEHPICSWTPAIPYLPTTTAGQRAAFVYPFTLQLPPPESQKGCSFLLTTRIVPSSPNPTFSPPQ